MMDVNVVLQQAHDHLADAGIDSAKAEAGILVAHVLEIERGKLRVMQALGESISSATADQIFELVAARATRTPLQYLTGTAAFFGIEVSVEPGVFIPRVETEILVETTLQHFATATGPLKILDLCTGTGVIAAALGNEFAHRNIPVALWAIDIDSAAAQLARHNTLEYNVTVLCADVTDAGAVLESDPELAKHIGTFDAVVSNPPYVPTTTPVTQTEARHDPERSLYGGSADGTSIPLEIVDQAEMWLAPGGLFIMEHDHTHADQLRTALAHRAQWRDVVTVQDLTHADRFLQAIRSDLVQPTQKFTTTLAQ